MLAERGLTFGRSELSSYAQATKEFRPSTLTSKLPDETNWFDLWLDPAMLGVMEGYMGFFHHWEEA